MLKIAFIGLGSIAKRHIRNLCQILDSRSETYEMDVFRHECKLILEPDIRERISNVYMENELEEHEYDIIFITNPTSEHFNTIQRCAAHAKHMFIEKPVFDRCDIRMEDMNLKAGATYYVACPLRYMSVLQYVKKNIELNRVISAQAISSSYLPDWRPGTDYRNAYSAHKELGGGVAIDLIHEWDYLVSLFGFPEEVLYAGGKYSELEIDSDDLAVYIGVYKNMLVELHLDYFGRKIIRQLLLLMPEETVRVDLANARVIYEKSNRIIELVEERDQYQKRELEHFLDIIDGTIENDNTIEDALRVLKIAKNKGGN